MKLKVPQKRALVDVPPLVHLLVAGVSTTGALLVTQSLISNRTEKLVTGLASIWIPLGYLLMVAILHLAHARTTAARITAGLPTKPTLERLVP